MKGESKTGSAKGCDVAKKSMGLTLSWKGRNEAVSQVDHARAKKYLNESSAYVYCTDMK